MQISGWSLVTQFEVKVSSGSSISFENLGLALDEQTTKLTVLNFKLIEMTSLCTTKWYVWY